MKLILIPIILIKVNIMKLNEKWFINLSSVNFPLEGLLQLGDGFCLPPCNVKSKYIKHIENNVLKLKGNNKI